MTVAAKNPSVERIENGVTVAFDVPFRFRAPEHIVARRIAADGAVTELAYGTDYSVSGGASDAGGTLTVTAPAAPGVRLQMRRVTPRIQSMNYATSDTFPAESHEGALDTAMLVDQEQDAAIADVGDRAIKVPIGELAQDLPVWSERAGSYLAFDGIGRPFAAAGTGGDAALRTDIATDAGADLMAFRQPLAGSVKTTVRAELARHVFLEQFGVSAITSAAFNSAALQTAFDTLAHEVILPPYSLVMNATSQFRAHGQVLRGVSRGKSRLVKSADTDPRLVYGESLFDLTIDSVEIDGNRSQSTNFVDAKWLVFFRLCTRPTVKNCRLHKCLTDALVFELCIEPFSEGNFCNDNNKGGIYWSACDGGQSVRDTCDNNGASVDGIGNGFLIACTWGLILTGAMAKNNIQGQVVGSRGSRHIQIVGGKLGDRLQTRGTYSVYTIGEATSGTVHGITYDGATLYGVEDLRVSNVECYLPPLLSKTARFDFESCHIENLSATQVHGAIIFGSTKGSFRGGRLINANGSGVGFALVADPATPKLTPTNPTDMLFDGVDFNVASGNRVNDYSGGPATWVERMSMVQGVPVARTAILDLTVTPTSGSLPAITNEVTIANTATPTTVELLKYCVELETRVEGMLTRLRALGLLAP